MVISEIGIRGFKSYGNQEQVVKLNTEKGELILLVGNNGAGKSSFLSSFDWTLYGQVRGRNKKKVKLSSLPNRINGEMLNRIKFKSGNTDVEIKRGLGPSVLELWENGIYDEKAGKGFIDSRIEKLVGMDLETFKSFISMSINDFKNFISLSNEEKQLLVDKLFNLEVINIFNSILKELVKTNKSDILVLDREIETYEDSIERLTQSLQRTIDMEKENLGSEIEAIKEAMESRKDEYLELKDKIEKIKIRHKEIDELLEKEKKEYIIVNQNIKNIDESINLYNSGKCPTCESDFNSDHYINLKTDLIDKKSSLLKLKSEIDENVKNVKMRKDRFLEMSQKYDKSWNEISYFLKNSKSEIEKLTKKKDSNKVSSNQINEFKSTINDLKDKQKDSSIKKGSLKNKELYYKELSKIFSEDGVKKSIISGIIKPINSFISENNKVMNISFDVELDDTFTAKIKALGEEVDHESLSTGETRRINISILIAYLKLIRTKKYINILFLDEIFSSIDLEGIDDILSLLKNFANEYNINIFVVHHALMNEGVFDRIFIINKDVFSQIEEVNYGF